MRRSATQPHRHRHVAATVAMGLVLAALTEAAQKDVTTDTHAASTTTQGVTATNEFDGLRDPFWPVGYVPDPPALETAAEQAASVAAEPEVVIEWPALRLRGLTRAANGNYMALIEGLGWVEKGDSVRCVRREVLYEWRIGDVGEDGVRCDRVAATPMSEVRKREAQLRESLPDVDIPGESE
jgi:hypothetical protein